jgi:hypothetical protein
MAEVAAALTWDDSSYTRMQSEPVVSVTEPVEKQEMEVGANVIAGR